MSPHWQQFSEAVFTTPIIKINNLSCWGYKIFSGAPPPSQENTPYVLQHRFFLCSSQNVNNSFTTIEPIANQPTNQGRWFERIHDPHHTTVEKVVSPTTAAIHCGFEHFRFDDDLLSSSRRYSYMTAISKKINKILGSSIEESTVPSFISACVRTVRTCKVATSPNGYQFQGKNISMHWENFRCLVYNQSTVKI